MIEPMMATMLGFLTTDAAVAPPLLRRVLREVVDNTFNAITVDGECSTNDCVMLLANGASGVTIDEANYDMFAQALETVCLRLALGIVRGGEGATKLVTVTVTGAATNADARKAAKVIANSPLVKTAVHGGDPNWGRLIAAAGRAGVEFDLSRAAVTIGSIVLFKDGRPHDEAAPEAAQVSAQRRDRHRGRSRRRHGLVHGLDVRSQRRLRPHQRRVPDMRASRRKMMAPTAAAEDRQGLPVDPRLRSRRPRAVPSPRRAGQEPIARSDAMRRPPMRSAAATSRCCSKRRRCAPARRSRSRCASSAAR